MSRLIDSRSIQKIQTEPSKHEVKSVLPKLGRETSSPKSCDQRHVKSLMECIQSAKNKKWKLKKPFKDHYKQMRPRRHTQKSQISVFLNDIQDIELKSSKLFCTGSSQRSAIEDESSPQSKTKDLNDAIEKSKGFVSLVRTNRQKLTKLKINYMRTKDDEVLPPKQIYNYLERKLVVSKQKQINDDIVKRYAGYSPPKKLEGVDQQSRKFLLDKMRNDYRNYTQVQSYRKEHIRSMILEELDDRKKQYSKDYHKRYNIPYFSYLSLSNTEKQNVLTRKARKSFL